MSFLKKLFARSSDIPKRPEAIEHEGFRIFAAPQKDAGGFRISATIEKDIGGETKTHTLIRADIVSDFDGAVEATVMKAKHVIDQQGDGIF